VPIFTKETLQAQRVFTAKEQSSRPPSPTTCQINTALQPSSSPSQVSPHSKTIQLRWL